MRIKNLMAIALMLLTSAFCAMAQDMAVPQDTAVHTGKLANGLTYYVRYNNYPEHHVNFYIAQRVGSLQEEESQRGLAHFLEHMCFNGTEHFKGNGVIDYTRSLGVEFGRDLNAYTSIDQTVYNISDVPSGRQSALDSCLLILKDWSNGLLLEDKEIDEERGVIHEEWRMRLSPSQRMLERDLETLYPGSKYGKRMPIGLMSVVDGFKYKELRDYYHKWYRPDNQAIIVVGDINVPYTINKIKELFGSIPAPAKDAAQVTEEPVPDNNEPIIVVDKDKEQQYSIVQLMYKHDPFPENMKGGVQYLAYGYVQDMIDQMFGMRFQEKSQDPNCPFIQAGAGDGQYLFSKTKDAFQVYALPKEGKTAEALQSALETVLQARKYGFTATEYERAKSDYLSNLEKAYNNRDKQSTERFGRLYASNYLEKEPMTSIETKYQMMNMLAPNIPVEAINEALKEFVSLSDTNMVVINFNQEKEGAVYPTVASLKAAIDAAHAAKIEPYVDNVKQEPLMSTMPKPGKIVKETKNDKLGYTELTLSNGAKVVLKPTTFKEDEIKYQAEAKGGSSLYGPKDYATSSLFGTIIGVSGLGDFSNTELTKALAGKNVNVDLDMSTSYTRLNGNSTKKDLETMLQLNYLYFTNIKKDQKQYDATMSLIENALKNKSLRPESVFADSVSYTMGNHSWRNKPFYADDLKNASYDRALQIAKERTANAADFTFYFVGSFDMATIKPLIEQYIASLPGDKSKKSNYKNVASYPHGKVTNIFTKKMETPKPMCRMVWFNDKAPYSLENSIKAGVVGDILDKLYLQEIREKASAAYSPGAGGGAQVTGDVPYTYVLGQVQMKPEKKDLAIKLMRDEMLSIGKTVDAGTLKDIQAKMIKDADENAKENSYWMDVLSMYVGRGIDLHTSYKSIVSSLTPQSIKDFVNKVILSSGNEVEVTMLPAE